MQTWTEWKGKANLSGPTKINVPEAQPYFTAHSVDYGSPDKINFKAKCGGISQPQAY